MSECLKDAEPSVHVVSGLFLPHILSSSLHFTHTLADNHDLDLIDNTSLVSLKISSASLERSAVLHPLVEADESILRGRLSPNPARRISSPHR